MKGSQGEASSLVVLQERDTEAAHPPHGEPGPDAALARRRVRTIGGRSQTTGCHFGNRPGGWHACLIWPGLIDRCRTSAPFATARNHRRPNRPSTTTPAPCTRSPTCRTRAEETSASSQPKPPSRSASPPSAHPHAARGTNCPERGYLGLQEMLLNTANRRGFMHPSPPKSDVAPASAISR